MINVKVLKLAAILVASATALPISLSRTIPTTTTRMGYSNNGWFNKIIPTGSLPPLPSPHPSEAHQTSAPISEVAYTHYTGDGSTSAGWPSQEDWIDFDTMWTHNKAAFIDKTPNNPVDNQNLRDTIDDVSKRYNLDPRLILAVTIQESKGNVRVQTTQFPQGSNPGLMQTHNGLGSCAGLTVCPESMIKTMIEEGSATGSDGVNLKDLVDGSGAVDVSKYYIAARKYNSGVNSIGPDGDLSAPGATQSYASDIANRLVGYIGEQGGVM